MIDEDDSEEVCYYLLLEHGVKANPNLVDEATNLTPLCAAIQNNTSNIIVQQLIEAGADIDLPADNMTPVQWAAFHASELLIFLVKKGAKLSKKGDEMNLYGSVAHVACLADNTDALKMLVSDEVAANNTDQEFNPILMITVDVNYGDNTCLHVSAMQGHVACFKLIIDFAKAAFAGKDELLKKIVCRQNRQGNTCFHEAFEN